MNARFAVSLVALHAVACGPQGGFSLKKSLLSLTSARGVIIAPASGQNGSALTSNATSGPPQRLYTMNADGSITETSVVEGTEEGESTSFQPIAIYETPAYLAVAFEGLMVERDLECPFVLARRSDGVLFCLPIGGGKAEDLLRGGGAYFDKLQSNEAGDLLWVNHLGGLVRVDLTNPETPNATNPIDSDFTGGRTFDAVRVNGRGDVLLSASFETKQTRIQRASGGFQNLSTEGSTCLSRGFAANPNDFYLVSQGRAQKHVDGSPFSQVELGALPGTGDINASFDCGTGLVRTSDSLLTAAVRTLIEISDTGVQPFAVPTLNKVTQLSGSSVAVMLLGQDAMGNSGIVKFEPSSSTFTTLLTPGEYAITKMVVAPNGDTTFQGQRASDGANILGNIAVGSTEVEIVSTGFPNIVSLIRLN